LRRTAQAYCAFKNHIKFKTKLLVYEKYKIITSGEGRIRAALIPTNNRVHTLLTKQLSDEDTVILEVITYNIKIVSQHLLRYKSAKKIDLLKIEAIKQYANVAGVLIPMDSNSRSTS